VKNTVRAKHDVLRARPIRVEEEVMPNRKLLGLTAFVAVLSAICGCVPQSIYDGEVQRRIQAEQFAAAAEKRATAADDRAASAERRADLAERRAENAEERAERAEGKWWVKFFLTLFVIAAAIAAIQAVVIAFYRGKAVKEVQLESLLEKLTAEPELLCLPAPQESRSRNVRNVH
jgi:hypothetical protein